MIIAPAPYISIDTKSYQLEMPMSTNSYPRQARLRLESWWQPVYNLSASGYYMANHVFPSEG